MVKDNFTISDDEYKVIERMNNDTINEVLKKFNKNIEEYVARNSVSDVIDAVRGLPKEDMATLAEAIVEVAALRKKVSPGIESVGGPVDVAVVTKGDGFIWAKRKHYFELNKNLHYLRRRFGNLSMLEVGGTDGG